MRNRLIRIEPNTEAVGVIENMDMFKDGEDMNKLKKGITTLALAIFGLNLQSVVRRTAYNSVLEFSFCKPTLGNSTVQMLKWQIKSTRRAEK